MWADVKYHVPPGFGFSPQASGFYPFGAATALPTQGGVGGVAWLITCPAANQTCHSTNDKCEALASTKGCFLCFLFLCHPQIAWRMAAVLVISLFFSKFVKTIIHITYNSHAL